MPSLQPPSTVLVTGASGFIAAWVSKTLLERGHTVRGTVRSTAKGEYLRAIFKAYGDRFTYVIVEDVAKEDAFDEAVKGVDAVQHMAAVVTFSAEDPKDLIDPAVNGTLGVLKSVKKNAPNVKRVVVTSSAATLFQPHPEIPSYKYSEVDWNQFSVDEVERLGSEASGVHKYRASKVLAERALWKFVDENPDVSFDAVAIIPPFVYGPVIHEVPSPDKLNLSAKDILDIVNGFSTNPNFKTPEELVTPVANLVDVRDVAWAHAEALINEKAGGQRFCVALQPFCLQDILDAINSADPPLPVQVPRGNPGKTVVHPAVVDGSKAKSELGINYTRLPKLIGDTILSFKARGW